MLETLQVFLLSMVPLGELRAAIPVGIAIYHLNPALVFLVSIIGNIIPPLLIVIFLKRISPYLSKKSKIFKKGYEWWQDRVHRKHFEKIQKYGPIGLAVFVAIPLPMTGAWTGALLAVLADFTFKKAFLSLFTGVVIAGIIVTTIIMLGISITENLGWQVLLAIIMVVVLIYWYFKK